MGSVAARPKNFGSHIQEGPKALGPGVEDRPT